MSNPAYPQQQNGQLQNQAYDYQAAQNQLQQQQDQMMQQEQFVPNQQMQNQSELYPRNQGTMDNLYQNQSYVYGQTSQTEGRRKYPKTLQDQKTEWHGVEVHKKEVDNEIARNENDIRNIKMKHLLTELDKKLLEEYELKREKLKIKQMEAEQMMRQMQAYQDQLRKNKEDKVTIQGHLSNCYDYQRQEQADRDKEYRQQKLEWENKLIEYNQERLKSEQGRNRFQKDYLNQEKQSDLQRGYVKKQQDYDDHIKGKAEHNELMRINAEKQLIKEENYRQFYRDIAENQEQQYLVHYDSVMKPMLTKIAELEAIINRNVNEAQVRRAQEELTKLLKKKQELMSMNDVNVHKMQDNQLQKESYKIEKQQKVNERLQDLANYNEYLDHKRKEKYADQAKLKNFLDAQAEEKYNQHLNKERMTKNEKGFNRMDLQAYKEREGGLYTMLPGWSPQVGQLPPRQNRDQLTRQIMDTMKPQDKRTNANFNNMQPTFTASNNMMPAQNQQSSTRLANAGMSALHRNNASVPNMSQVREFSRVGEPLHHFQKTVVDADETYGKAYKEKEQYKYNHNPITNPMPYNVQNPYIQQQYLNLNPNSSQNRTLQQTSQLYQQQQQPQQQQYQQQPQQQQYQQQPQQVSAQQ